MNEIHDEVAAIESALGPNPGSLHDPLHTPNTVGALLDTLDFGKSPITHTHTALPALTLGGPVSGLYISASLNSLQALNQQSVTPLLLQPQGGDLHIGSTGAAGSQVTVYGGLSAQGGINTSVLSASSVATPTVSLGNGASLEGLGYGVTALTGDSSYYQFVVSGQIIAEVNNPVPSGVPAPGFAAASTANLVLKTLDSSKAVLATWADAGANGPGGYAMQTDTVEAGLGFQLYCTDGDHPVVASAAGFVTVYDGEAKPGEPGTYYTRTVSNLQTGLAEIGQLRPVQFMLPHPLLDCPYGQLVPSQGDQQRYATAHHGLLPSEVSSVLPEVVHLSADGTPHGIDMGALVPTLVNAINELNDKLNTLTDAHQALLDEVHGTGDRS